MIEFVLILLVLIVIKLSIRIKRLEANMDVVKTSERIRLETHLERGATIDKNKKH